VHSISDVNIYARSSAAVKIPHDIQSTRTPPMTFSPPLTVLAILAAALAGTAWLAPEPSLLRPVTVSLSAGDYDELTKEARRRSTAEGSQMSVSGIIEEKLFTGKSFK
jgi:hypothetical protein